ncbi:MAG TPA: hypothetical protein VF432_15930 [Thermoanaerobaculia bacterium]
MKRFLLVGTILFCAAVVAILAEIVRRSFFEKPGSPSHLKRIALQINEREWETNEDSVVVPVSAQAGDRRLTMQYELLTASAAEVDDVTRREVREVMRRGACEKDAFRELLDAGVTLQYVINDSDGAPVLSTEVLRWECGGGLSAPSSR